MANNLVELLATLIDVSDYATDMKIPTVTPWLLLYSLIHSYVYAQYQFLLCLMGIY